MLDKSVWWRKLGTIRLNQTFVFTLECPEPLKGQGALHLTREEYIPRCFPNLSDNKNLLKSILSH